MKEERFYKLGEVAAMLSVSRTQLKRWVTSKKIRAVKFGADVPRSPWHISESALEEFKKNNSRHNTDRSDP